MSRQGDAGRKVRRHAAVLSRLGYLASARTPSEGFGRGCALVANAVEVDHVKLSRYRPSTGDLLMEAGVGWRDGVIGSATCPTDDGVATGPVG